MKKTNQWKKWETAFFSYLKKVKTPLVPYLEKVRQKMIVTIFALIPACGFAVWTLTVSGNFVVALFTGVSAYFLFTSTSSWKDVWRSSILACLISYAYRPNLPLAIGIGLATGLIVYTLFAIISDTAKKNKWFTNINLNEFLVIQTGKNMLEKYIGVSERWVSETGIVENTAKKSESAKLVRFMPDPKTGLIRRVDTASIFLDIEALFALYLIKRTGAIWVGLPKITNVKTFDMHFVVWKDGKPVPKSYEGDKAAKSIFDSFTYLFVAESVETLNTAKVTVKGLVTLTVHNLHTPSYGALPAGIWTDKAHEVFLDKVRIHGAKTDYGTLLKERHSVMAAMTPEEIEEYTTKQKQKVETAKMTLYQEFMSAETQADMIRATGHFITNVQIGDITLDGNKEYADSLLKESIAENEGKGKLKEQEYRTKIAKEAVKTAEEEGAATLFHLMAPINARKAYVTEVLGPIADNPDALNAVNVHAIAQMDNLQVLGSSAGIVLNQESRQKRGVKPEDTQNNESESKKEGGKE